MNEQLQQAVASLITASLAAFDTGVNFLSEQIPDVVQQLLLWKAIESFAHFFFFGICVLLVVAWWINKQIKFWSTPIPDHYNRTVPRISGDSGPLVMCNLFLIFPIWIGIANVANWTWIQIWLAPKVFLIEYSKVLLK